MPFQGCVIPPLTPRWDMSTEDAGLPRPSTDADKFGPGRRAGAPAGVDHGVNVLLRHGICAALSVLIPLMLFVAAQRHRARER